jgi:hypothetical protein
MLLEWSSIGPAKRILNAKLEGRKRGRPTLRHQDGVANDTVHICKKCGPPCWLPAQKSLYHFLVAFIM